MHATDSAVQLLGISPIIAAGAGYSAQTRIAGIRHKPYAAVLARFAAALLWGCGGVATLTAIGVSASVTVPLALTVFAVVMLALALAFAGGMFRPRETAVNP
ncbi:hypothetical protein [Nocardia lasii]|uniref:Uncharacterized protein n=1 Tax=Nocardia lasii TaxID=1616107 RepID=A0ABW1JXS8_9NOCA